LESLRNFFRVPPKPDLAVKFRQLKKIMEEHNRWFLAYSGGLDSSLLLSFAAFETFIRITPVFVDHELVPSGERQRAKRFVDLLRGCLDSKDKIDALLTVDVSVLDVPEVKNNSRSRCYFCKLMIMNKILDIAKSEGGLVCDGTLTTDNALHRPGIKALKELRIRSPLSECGITKGDSIVFGNVLVEQTGFEWMRFESCLATRLPYDSPITVDLLKGLDTVERIVKREVRGPVRARYHPEYKMVRLEIAVEEFGIFLRTDLANRLVDEVRSLGFSRVVLDLEGYREED